MLFRSLLLSLAFFAHTAAAQDTVTLLDRGEPYDVMVADGGTLWVGQSRLNFSSDYRLEAYDMNGRLIDRVRLSHSLWELEAAGNDSVMITGMNPTARLTEYTRAKLVNGHIQTVTTRVALGGFITFWVGDIGNRHYFVDQGGNPNDDGPLGEPAQTLFTTTGSNASYLSTRLRMPTDGKVIDGKMYLMSSEGIGSTNAKIAEVDPRTQAVRVIYQSRTAGMTNLLPVANGRYLLSSGRAENKLILTDRIAGGLVREFPTKGFTRAVAAFGHCVLAGNDETNSIEAFDLSTMADEPVYRAAVKLEPEEWSGLKKIAVDQTTGTLFARAAQACNPLVEVCDKDYNRVVKFAPEVAAALRAACSN